MRPIFVIKFSGVSDLQGVKVPVFPLTLLVIVTTVLRYRAACDIQWRMSRNDLHDLERPLKSKQRSRSFILVPINSSYS